jgi:hypothetical protein
MIAIAVFSCSKDQVIEPPKEYHPFVTITNEANLFSVTADVRDTSFLFSDKIIFQSDSISYDVDIQDHSSGFVNIYYGGTFYHHQDYIVSDTTILDVRSIGYKPISGSIIVANFSGKLSIIIKALPTDLYKRLDGSWNWILTSGGYNGGTFTPETEGYTKVYTFNSIDSTFTCYLADTLFYTSYYSIDEMLWKLHIGNTFFSYGNQHIIIYFGRDTLHLMHDVTDAPMETFVRTP